MAKNKVTIFDSNNKSLENWFHYYNMLTQRGIYHCPEYIKTLESNSGDQAQLFIYENNKGNLVYYPFFRRSLADLPIASHKEFSEFDYFDIDSSWFYGGPLVQINDPSTKNEFLKSFIKAFSKYCIESNIVSEFIRFDANIRNHNYFNNLLPVAKNRETVYVDLLQHKDSIWENMAGRSRTAIRKALKSGVTVSISNSDEEASRFFDLYNSEMERKKAHSHYFFKQYFIQELFKNLGEKMELIYAEVNGIFISGGLFIYEKGEAAHYYLMANHHDFIRYQANNLILHKAILYFKKKNVKIFDLQGGREGVFNFKQSFSRSRSAFYTSGIIHNLHIYKKLTFFRNDILNNIGDDFFPAYRLRNTN